VAVVRGAAVDRAQQIEPFDNRPRPEIERIQDELGGCTLVAGAEGIDLDRHWLRHPDGIADLNLRLLGQS
jgi:hypothetical protein